MKYKLHPDVDYKFYLVGQEKTPFLVIDNFLSDAQSLVSYCIGNMQFSEVDNFYPGLRMAGPSDYFPTVICYLSDLLKNIFALPSDNIAGGKSLYSMVVTPPDQLEKIQCLPHIDSYLSGDIACVHYLCGKEQGGTSLYRHRKTGYEKITEASIDYYKKAVIAEGSLDFKKNTYMNGSNQFFEQIASIDSIFNRMIVYPSNILHSGNIAEDFTFNTNPTEGRLTLNTFIYTKRN